MAGCSGSIPEPATPTTPVLSDQLVFYDWEDDVPVSVFEGFHKEYGVQVAYITFESQEEAADNIEAGKVYDVVIIENDAVTYLTSHNMLSEIDYRNIPNFKNISPNFRDLSYDPGNKYTVPFNWGTTGLIVRSDLLETLPTHWADLWKPEYAGKIAIREDVPYDFVGLTLKSLGYSINTGDGDKLDAALERMLEIREDVILVGSSPSDVIPLLSSGEVTILVGWTEDLFAAQEESMAVTYILPWEGAMLWGDNFAIPANSPNQYTAEVFLNYLLRPAVSAQITDHNYYATANKAAEAFIDTEILNNPAVYPPSGVLENAEVFSPRSNESDQRIYDLWEKFLAAGESTQYESSDDE